MNIKEYIEKKAPAFPNKLEKWIYRDCAEIAYIKYDKKHNEAVCTSCGSWFGTDEEMKHNSTGFCPSCGRSVMYKSVGRGMQNAMDSFRVLYCANKGKTVWVESWEISLVYDGIFGRPLIRKFLAEVLTINSKEQHHYKQGRGCWDYGIWKEVNSMKLPHFNGGSCYGYNTPPFETVFVYRENLRNVFQKSDLKYLWVDEFVELLNAFQLVKYMSDGMRLRSVELLVKAGFTQVVIHRLSGYGGLNALNWRGKELPKILRLTKGETRRLRKMDPTLSEIQTFQLLTAIERTLVNNDELEEMSRLYRKTEIAEYTSLLKYARYSQKNKGVYEHSWLDYIQAAEKLGMNVKDKNILFPKDFKTAHDRATDRIFLKKNAELSEQIEDKIPDVMYGNNEMMIIPARSIEDLVNESYHLHHCVRTYGQRIADGKCYIFFVRNSDKKDKPYYTLETDPTGVMVQCRGFENCSMTEEVNQFVRGFCECLRKEMNKRRKTA